MDCNRIEKAIEGLRNKLLTCDEESLVNYLESNKDDLEECFSD